MRWQTAVLCMLVTACSRGENLGAGRPPTTEPRVPTSPAEARRAAPVVCVGIVVDTTAVTVSAPADLSCAA
jgi:hypothetical protein